MGVQRPVTSITEGRGMGDLRGMRRVWEWQRPVTLMTEDSGLGDLGGMRRAWGQ